jgi:hypothetical protein
MWNDHAITTETLKSMNKLQKINHFPGMNELSRKNRLAKNLNMMRKEHPQVNSKPQLAVQFLSLNVGPPV